MGKQDIFAVADDKQLFIDDYFLAEQAGVKLVMNSPRKTRQKLLTAEGAWEDAKVGRYFTVIDDDGLYRMWYEAYSYPHGRPEPGKKAPLFGKLCYAESTDGITWNKPRLGLVDYSGSMDNNIMYPTPGRQYHGGTVFKDPTAPRSERYKIVYGLGGVGLVGGWSADGIHWQMNERQPLLLSQCDTQNVCFWDERIGKYVGYVRLNLPVRNPEATRTIGRCETADFWRWPHPEKVLSCDEQDPPNTDMYNAATVKYPYAENAYFIYTSIYNHDTDRLDVHLAVSRDGIAWSRPSRQPFIELGEPGSFDGGMVHVGTGQIRRGHEYWVYYCGVSLEHSSFGKRQLSYDGTMSTAVSRLDGFVSLDAGDAEGWALTTPIVFDGKGLELNYQASPEGYVRVAVCDGSGRPLEHFKPEQCKKLTGDAIAGEVHWKEAADLARLAGSPVKLKFILRNAKLYAFQFV